MKAAFLIWAVVLLGCTATAQPLSTSIPNAILDSMIFEIRYARQCSEVVKAQANELQKQGAELIATGTALKLSMSESEKLTGLVSNYEQGERLLKREYEIKEKALKKKVKRVKLIVIGQVVLIVILLL